MKRLLILATLVAVAGADDDLASREEAAWRNAVAAVADSVVQIRLVGGLETVDKVLVSQGPTTGLFVSADGYIVSSAYPFAQRPSSILVMLPGGDRLPARLVATNHSRKFVLLKVDPPAPLPAIPNPDFFGETGFRDVHPGQWAIAVGRTMQPDVVNTSVGVISAVGRKQGRALQTDAKVSPASYGGPLVDVRGRVLGVLVPISPEGESEVAGASFYDSGIAFAVPMAQIFAALPRLRAGEDLYRGLLGVSFPKGASYRQPPRVDTVHPGSPADGAGIQPEDLILAVDGRAVATVANLRTALGPRYAGDRVEIKLRRGEEELAMTAQLVAKLPPLEKESPDP